MAQTNEIVSEVNKKHQRLFRYLNNSWIFTQKMRPELREKAHELRNSKSKLKKKYPVPREGSAVVTSRRDSDIGDIYQAQVDRGVFESNVVNIVSRVEAFIQECMTVAILRYPEKIGVLAVKDKNEDDKEGKGIPVEMFLANRTYEDVLARYIASRCEGLMFGKPADYLAKAAKVLSITIEKKTIDDYIEIKATRDIIVHGTGIINKIYLDKAKQSARGNLGEELTIDQKYFRHVVITAKLLADQIEDGVEDVYG